MEDKKFELFASCLSGLEAVLAEELKRLGAKSVRPLGGGVSFSSDVQGVLKICLWSRLASRVLLVVGRINASDAKLLYEGVRRMPWEEVIAPGSSMSVQAHGMNDELRNTRFTALKVKDAVCDRLREARGERPDVDSSQADANIDVRIRDSRATISFDLSGASMYNRSYLAEDESADAPLECALAAGLLALSGWDKAARKGAVCVDAACGDGALVLESAMVACDVAPSLARDTWGFFGWSCFDDEVWNALLDDADDRFDAGLLNVLGSAYDEEDDLGRPNLDVVRFVGATTSSPAIARARQRAKRAGLRQAVSIEPGDAKSVEEMVKRISKVAQQAHQECTLARPSLADKAPEFLVASVLPTGDRAQSEARSQAEAAAVVRVSLIAPEGARFSIAGGEDIDARFGVDPQARLTLGSGRIETEVLLFNEPPKEPVVVMIPDNAGGSEHRVEVFESASEQFAARLRKVAKERRKWAKREGIGCYRIYDADLADYAVTVDLYTGAGQAAGNTYVHIAEYAPPASVDPAKAARRFDDVLAITPVVLGVRPDHIFAKVRRRDKGGSQYRGASRRSYVTHVVENAYLLEVDLSGYLDTGLFLDHRITRNLVGSKAAGKRFLNLFAYTGSATVHAAGGGAESTCTVDLSQTYLEWAQRNMEQNGFEGEYHTYERADVMRWITECRRTPQRFDLIFVDPPTFSNSKAMGKRTWDVQRDHVELLIGVSRLLTEDGEAIFSCNLRNFKPNLEELEKYGVTIQDISAETIPHDFERNPRIHKCFLVKRK